MKVLLNCWYLGRVMRNAMMVVLQRLDEGGEPGQIDATGYYSIRLDLVPYFYDLMLTARCTPSTIFFGSTPECSCVAVGSDGIKPEAKAWSRANRRLLRKNMVKGVCVASPPFLLC